MSCKFDFNIGSNANVMAVYKVPEDLNSMCDGELPGRRRQDNPVLQFSTSSHCSCDLDMIRVSYILN